MTGEVAELVALLALGVGSALVPVINAEAVVVAAAATDAAWVAPVVLIGLGQGVGKVAIFLGVRRGSRWARRFQRAGENPRRLRSRLGSRLVDVNQRMLGMLGRPVIGGAVVSASALVGFPPLLLVAVASGLSTVSVRVFSVCVICGRVLRFVIIAYPVASAAQ